MKITDFIGLLTSLGISPERAKQVATKAVAATAPTSPTGPPMQTGAMTEEDDAEIRRARQTYSVPTYRQPQAVAVPVPRRGPAGELITMPGTGPLPYYEWRDSGAEAERAAAWRARAPRSPADVYASAPGDGGPSPKDIDMREWEANMDMAARGQAAQLGPSKAAWARYQQLLAIEEAKRAALRESLPPVGLKPGTSYTSDSFYSGADAGGE